MRLMDRKAGRLGCLAMRRDNSLVNSSHQLLLNFLSIFVFVIIVVVFFNVILVHLQSL